MTDKYKPLVDELFDLLEKSSSYKKLVHQTIESFAEQDEDAYDNDRGPRPVWPLDTDTVFDRMGGVNYILEGLTARKLGGRIADLIEAIDIALNEDPFGTVDIDRYLDKKAYDLFMKIPGDIGGQRIYDKATSYRRAPQSENLGLVDQLYALLARDPGFELVMRDAVEEMANVDAEAYLRGDGGYTRLPEWPGFKKFVDTYGGSYPLHGAMPSKVSNKARLLMDIIEDLLSDPRERQVLTPVLEKQFLQLLMRRVGESSARRIYEDVRDIALGTLVDETVMASTTRLASQWLKQWLPNS